MDWPSLDRRQGVLSIIQEYEPVESHEAINHETVNSFDASEPLPFSLEHLESPSASINAERSKKRGKDHQVVGVQNSMSFTGSLDVNRKQTMLSGLQVTSSKKKLVLNDASRKKYSQSSFFLSSENETGMPLEKGTILNRSQSFLFTR